jgi:adenine-specific DNA-methyltransferase
MTPAFVQKSGGVVVENHLNMVRPAGEPIVSLQAVATILNSNVVDQMFRCISGSVAVSAFELESLPLPSIEQMQSLEQLLGKGASAAEVNAMIAGFYRQTSL